MSTFFLMAAVFCFGMAAGGILTVYQACRPNGYEAINGKRYRLTGVSD